MTTPTHEEINDYARQVVEQAKVVLAAIKEIRNVEIPVAPLEYDDEEPDDATFAAAMFLVNILEYCKTEPTEAIGDPVSINDLQEKIELLESLLD
ncbi:MAG: hypothetical protein RIC55_35255 [Pirellulaceae bacterium]